MNCSVSAGPTIDLPLFQLTGPCMCGLRMPMWPSVPATVAAPMSFSASMRSLGGRMMPGVWVMRLSPWNRWGGYQLVTEPSVRRRCGASQNLKLCFLTSASSTSTPRPGASGTS